MKLGQPNKDIFKRSPRVMLMQAITTNQFIPEEILLQATAIVFNRKKAKVFGA